MRSRNPKSLKGAQKGITLVLISLILLILIGMGAFAMDLNHQVLNKARLQNAVDSAALAAAVVADDTGDVDLAETAAVQALTSFAAASGNQELVYTAENIAVTFSNDKQTFVDADSFSFSADDDIYVRVAVSDVSLTQYLAFVFNVGKSVSASAVAGPSAGIAYACNIMPMAVCGLDNGNGFWGYEPDGYDPTDPSFNSPSRIHGLKVGDQNNTDMGPGNFQLIDFNQSTVEEIEEETNSNNGNDNGNDGGGAALVRQAMAGAYNGCATIGKTVITKPGGSFGPVAQGINTRLNDFSGPIKAGGDVKPDIYVKEANLEVDGNGSVTSSDFYFTDYESCKNGGCDGSSVYPSDGVEDRRILTVPIVDCTEDSTGKTEFTILGFGCYFLMQKVDGNAGQDEGNIFGQFLYDCPINNGSTSVEPSDSGFYRIQLYKDPLSGAS
ncbi:pilus assembly protein TadG-related protein [Vibrio natriegens]|uniref:pilus assembly protein TadG-related protein n=1 Tax=Vibrio natriegens TaxID=691 RepID=UPI001FB9BCB8|nr:pilus assembly protein TadG-related protein [Vibrio natriegens]